MSLGILALDSWYKAENKSAIFGFVEKNILGKFDSMKEKREQFIANYSKNSANQNIAEYIEEEIKS